MTTPDNTRQLAAASYRLAAVDQDFMLADAQRGLRFMLEYEKAEQAMRARGVRSTIVVFGSARIRPADQPPAVAGLPASQRERHDHWYQQARLFATIASQRGGALRHADEGRDNVIMTGGGPGIMEAANRGASEVGAASIGLNITLPHEQMPNPWSTPDLTFRFHYFAMRKMHFALRAAALVAFPGGFGTLDELFEVLTLCQTRKMPRVPVVLFDTAYWRRMIDFELLVEERMIDPQDVGLLSFADDAEEVWRQLVEQGLAIPPEAD
ncbi:MAG: TIGR00730 family Rossman fold protein [Burkholderiaceae bacterium]